MKLRSFLFPFLAICIFCGGLNAQVLDSSQVYQKRQKRLLIGTTVLYASTLYSLDRLWYDGFARTSFHGFNDNKEWLGVDKLGHAYSAYSSAYAGIKAFEWAGYSRQQSAFIGGSIGWVFLATVEVFDGFSAEWGFSTGDIIANTIGSSIAISQYLLWDEQILRLKFSYTPSKYRELRPKLLGENELHAIFKDYNAQTYWASLNLHAINSNIQPKWLNLAFGYGGNGMVNAQNTFYSNEGIAYQHQRQYYLSLDIDFERIPTNKVWLRSVLSALNYIKIPFPAIEWQEGQKMQFKALQF